jgi:cell division protease FtsH
VVDHEDFEKARDKIFMGAERRSMLMSDEEKIMTAYHEAGHTLVARLLPRVDPVHKVTIIPRGRALGVTWTLPERDSYGRDREQMLQQISMAMGGRIAEEVFMGRMTTGASGDFQQATSMARDMVTRYGMSDLLGPMVYAENEGEVFLGRSVTNTKNVSEATMQTVDAEIRRIIDEQYQVARRLVEGNRDIMEAMKDALLKLETLDMEQIEDLMQRRPVRPAKVYSSGSSASGSDGPGEPPAAPVVVPPPPNEAPAQPSP